MGKKSWIAIILMIVCIVVISLVVSLKTRNIGEENQNTNLDNSLEQDYKCWDIKIFMSSPVWELAQAINEEDEELIK